MIGIGDFHRMTFDNYGKKVTFALILDRCDNECSPLCSFSSNVEKFKVEVRDGTKKYTAAD